MLTLSHSQFHALQGSVRSPKLVFERVIQGESTGHEGRTFTGDLFVDDDTLAMLELAARLATTSDDPDRPRAAWTLAWRLWRAMGRDDQAARVMGELNQLNRHDD